VLCQERRQCCRLATESPANTAVKPDSGIGPRIRRLAARLDLVGDTTRTIYAGVGRHRLRELFPGYVLDAHRIVAVDAWAWRGHVLADHP
jgi:hypothetical protein